MIPGYFIVKVAGHCNLSCRYCFAEPSFSGSLMDPDILAETLRQIDDLGVDNPKIGWHGGEPMMYGKEGIRKGLELQTSLKSQFCNSLQTNATLIDQGWIDLFNEYRVSVGVSLDGPEDVHNHNRPFRHGLGSFSQAKRGLELLLDNGISVGIISVISRYSDPESYFRFVKELGVSSFDMKPCTSTWEGAMSLEDFTVFQQEVFKLWLQYDNPGLTTRAFTGYAENSLGGTGNLCSLSGNCGNFVTIETNGDVYPCDELILPEFKMGNLTEAPLNEILMSSARCNFESMLGAHQEDCCQHCADYQVCRGGCTSARTFYSKDRYCSHLKEISRMVQGWTEGDMEVESNPTQTPEHDSMLSDTGRYMNIGQDHGSLQTRYAIGGIEAVQASKEVEHVERKASLNTSGTGDDDPH